MAGPAENVEKQSASDELAIATVDFETLQLTAAKLYGRGVPRAKIARALVDHLVPQNRHRPLEQRLSQARTKLRGWERSQKFRDMVYNLAVIELDMSTPGILAGIGRKAKKGRVDAARLALEITGRHNPKGDAAPTQVAVIFQDIPRPDARPGVGGTLERVPEVTDDEIQAAVVDMEGQS